MLFCLEPAPSDYNQPDRSHTETSRQICKEHLSTNWKCNSNAQKLQWPTLQFRSEAAITIMLFKVSHGLIAINKDNYLTPMTESSLRSYHPAKFQPLTTHSTKEIYKFSFMPTAVRLWNALPADVITSPSVNVFKAHIIRQLARADGFYLHLYIFCTSIHQLHMLKVFCHLGGIPGAVSLA